MAEGSVAEVLAGTAHYSVLHGDCLKRLRELPDNVADSGTTDPPYHLTSASRNGSPRTNDPETPFGRHAIGGKGFMNRTWDGGDIAFRPETWTEVLRVLKPGAHLVAFGGTRTAHRIACAIEDAGFECRDCLSWHYGQGFPKSLNVRLAINEHLCAQGGRHYPSGNLPKGAKAQPGDHVCEDVADSEPWHGFGTALKPSHEPIHLFRKPLDGTVAENLLKWGTGALNIDGCRIAHAGAADRAAHEAQVAAIKARGGSMENSWKNDSDLSGANEVNDAGRWPPNVLFTHAAGCRRIGTRAVAANPTWDTPNRDTEPSAFTGAAISKVRHGREGEPSAERRYDDRGATDFAPTPGARRDQATEEVDVWQCIEGCPVRQLGAQTGELTSGRDTVIRESGEGYRPSVFGVENRTAGTPQIFYGDSGTAARYFPQSSWDSELDDAAAFYYAAKAGRGERDAGLEHFRARSAAEATGSEDGQARLNSPRTGAGRTGGARNVHPTVKPLELIRWLVRLITPPRGIVLDPFLGSGTTGVAARAEGMRIIGCELFDTDEEPHVSIALARIAYIEGRTFVPRASLRAAEPPRQRSLF